MSFIKISLSYPLLIALIFLVNCRPESNKQETSAASWDNLTLDELSRISVQTLDDVTFEKSGRVSLHIDSVTQNPIIYPVYYDGGKDHFFSHYNRNINALDIYSMNTAQRIKRISFPIEGPESISRKSYPFIKSMDSIFLWSYDPLMILMLDSTGKRLDTYNLPGNPEDMNVNMIQPFFELEDNIIVAYQPQHYDPMLKDSSNFLVYDLKARKIRKSKAGRPLSVTNFPLYGSDAMPGICNGHNNSIINYFGAGQLIIRSKIDKDTLTYTILRSKFLPPTYPEPKHDGAVVLKQNFLKGRYFMMTYDPYRQYYYMMCLLDSEPFDNKGYANNVDDMQISVIIADTLFRRRGEMMLPKHEYFRSMFVTREGLLISNANPKNKTYHEDTLSYTIFKPVIK
jgi:hypothetical protein